MKTLIKKIITTKTDRFYNLVSLLPAKHNYLSFAAFLGLRLAASYESTEC